MVSSRLRLRLKTVWGCGARWALLGVLAGCLGGVARAAEKQAKPWMQFRLEQLGFPGVSPQFLVAGSSSLTVNFLDSTHLLLTFGLRTLVPRIEGDPHDDEDRMVAAEVIELPTGKVNARTEWHMHDHGRYLWSLGGGRFLVRIGDRMYTTAPLKNLGTKEPFALTLFPNRLGSAKVPVRPSLVFVSPDGGVVTLETVVEVPGQAKPTVQFGDQDSATVVGPKTRTVIEFYRVGEAVAGAGEEAVVQVTAAGDVQSPTPLLLPTDADGYLWAEDAGGGRWGLSFNPFQGQAMELGPMLSSCRPRLQMVSRSEFVAFTCRGSDDRLKLASYGLDGHETWEEPFGDVNSLVFAYAPVAGRFAVSHLALGASSGDMTAAVGVPERQEVRVYQTSSGDLLLKVECTPAFKTGENFDLSADGLMAAVVQSGAVAVYKLPAPTKRDAEDMAEVAKFAPPVGDGPVVLARLTRPAAPDTRRRLPGVGRPADEAASSAPNATATTVTAMEAAGALTPDATASTSDEGGAGGGGSVGPRSRPTLLKPGEKAEFQDKKPKVELPE